MKNITNVSKNRIITILGCVALVLPFTGFPHSWTDKFYFLIGLAIVILSFNLGKFLVYGEHDASKK